MCREVFSVISLILAKALDANRNIAFKLTCSIFEKVELSKGFYEIQDILTVKWHSNIQSRSKFP